MLQRRSDGDLALEALERAGWERVVAQKYPKHHVVIVQDITGV